MLYVCKSKSAVLTNNEFEIADNVNILEYTSHATARLQFLENT